MTDQKRWMPLYISDYLADTGHLGTIEHGAYFLLMMHYWRTGPLPGGDNQLRTIARMTAREWAKSRAVLLALFHVDGVTIRHKRIDAEIAEAEAIIESKVEAGREGARRRWQKHGRPNADANGKQMADPLPPPQHNQWQTDAQSPSHSPVPLAKANGRKSAADLFPENAKPVKVDPWKQVYDRGREVFGSSAGGIITNLRKHFDGKPRKVLAKIEDAAEMRTPIEWINAFLWEHGPPGIEVGAISPLP